MKEKIYVTGSRGLVGSRFIEMLPEKYEALTPEIEELDILDAAKVSQFIAKEKVVAVVNFAGITDVNGAQKENGNKDGLCWKVNVEGTNNIVKACVENNVFLIHISTDFIFPGNKNYPGPYEENDELPETQDGIGWYGWTKKVAEDKISEQRVRCAIARISYPFRVNYSGKKDFARSILSLYDEGKLYPMFSDQFITPTYIDEACRALYKILDGQMDGIYHLVTSERTTPYDFAKYLLRKVKGANIVIQKGSLEKLLNDPNSTPRPLVGGLENRDTQESLDMKFMTWKEAIDDFVRNLS